MSRCIMALLVVGATASSAWAQAPVYTELYRIGLWDTEHTSSLGQQTGAVWWTNALDQIAGTAWRFSDMTHTGDSTWVWTKTLGNVRTGLFDAEHTKSDGLRNSRLVGFSGSGGAIGWSDRYIGAATGGRSAWVWESTAGTVRLGFTDATHTRSDGVQTSQPVAQNNAGSVVGWSDRYIGAGSGGRTAWIWDAVGGSVRLGLTDALHTNTADGAQLSIPHGINSSGRVVGASRRYDGDSAQNFSAWTWTGADGYTQIGLMGADQTSAEGRRSSTPAVVTDSGRVFGTSRRFVGSTASNNQNAWMWTAAGGSAQVGLTGAEHTSSAGVQNSSFDFITQSYGDQVSGSSGRYSGVFPRGQTAWVWNPTRGTVRVGLEGARYFSGTGDRNSRVAGMNAAGYAWGYSTTYLNPTNGTASTGDDGWVWNPITGNTVQVGLTGGVYLESPTNDRVLSIYGVNNSGQAIGTSRMFSGPDSLGNVGWFFDPATGVNTPLVFSTSSTGRVGTTPRFLTESGYVFGTYDFFTGPSSVTAHAFMWSLSGGMVELGDLLAGQFPTLGVSGMSSVLGVREFELLIASGGVGALGGSGLFAALVPAPGAAGGMMLALGAGVMRRRRR